MERAAAVQPSTSNPLQLTPRDFVYPSLQDNVMNLRTKRHRSHDIARASVFAATLVSALHLSGCSAQQAYGASQAWQLQECSKIMNAQERSRCMASASTSYEDYKRQAEAAKAGN